MKHQDQILEGRREAIADYILKTNKIKKAIGPSDLVEVKKELDELEANGEDLVILDGQSLRGIAVKRYQFETPTPFVVFIIEFDQIVEEVAEAQLFDMIKAFC